MINLLTPFLCEPIRALFVMTVTAGALSKWKEAEVVPIHRKGSFHSVANYRPVSLTSVLCKVQVIRAAIYQHLTRNGILSDAQHGFVHRRTCLSNLLTFLDVVTKLLENGQGVDACYLDLRKAFDLVNHRLLLHKVKAVGIGSGCVRWVRSFLSERVFRVGLVGATSV